MAGNDQYTQLLLHMNEDPLIDSSTYNRTLTLHNGISRSDTEYKFGNYSAYFPRSTPDPGKKIEVSPSSNFNIGNFTNYVIEFWLKITEWESGWFIVGHGTPYNNYWAIHYDSQYGIFFSASNQAQGQGQWLLGYGNWKPEDDKWYHIAIIKTGSIIRLTGNGIVKDSRNIPANGFPDLSSESIYIGARYPSYIPSGHYVDEVRFSNTQRYDSFPFAPPNREFDIYTHYISGAVNDQSRIITLDESNWAVVSHKIFSTGSYEIGTTSGTKIAIGRRETDGEFIGYGNIYPILQ